MVGIVIVSHSEKIAEGVKALALQMAEEVPMAAAGGTSDGRIGTDMEKISNAINEVYSEDGVLVLFDLGSAFMNAEMALDFLPDDMKEKVEIVDAALVEGAVTAAVESSISKSREDIKKSLKSISINKMP
ncbi:PTS mannose transporter subunit IID [Clostridium carboxidivorans P7]|uniref:dihydroxyacetone kinase phosphoryl donor subunit DhaM n=1 Tax=Clostridium carboxidivorans TaxID=217159 RepID=UPI0001D394CB|nr:dihydroxyacetone kinase phosphoryl donor subunit DhaM [Clostridium carboxidivorans]AKN30658.1 PTS mannose transporter subunit IID [Clostridium carboxidivorans P7]EFG86416.1 dihydroxyacetone kinase, phosphotransfer subunit [Clostridium carboxidivorans P7]